MADMAQLARALKAADAAGDEAAARKLAAAIRAQRAKTAAEPAPAPSAAEPAGAPQPGGIKGALKSAGEVGLSLASGAVATPLAGLAGIAATALGGAEYGANVVEGVQNALTYQPRTEGGQKALELLAVPIEAYSKGADAIATGLSTGPDQQLGETLTYTALMAIPTLLGLKGLRGKGAAPRAPTAEELVNRAQMAYATAESAGINVPASTMRRMADEIVKTVAEEGIDANLHPASMAAIRRLQAAANSNHTLKGTEILRRVINEATQSEKPRDRRMAYIIRDKFDEIREGWTARDMAFSPPASSGRRRPGTAVAPRERPPAQETGTAVARPLSDRDYIEGEFTSSERVTPLGDRPVGPEPAADPSVAVRVLAEARQLWQRYRKSAAIEEIIDKAQIKAGDTPGTSLSRALRTQFRQLASNPKRMRQFNAEEQAVIRAMARGSVPESVLNALGSLAPRSNVSMAIGAGGGLVLSGGNPIAAAGVMAAGEISRRAAGARTLSRARRVAERMRAGRPLPSAPVPVNSLATTLGSGAGNALLDE